MKIYDIRDGKFEETEQNIEGADKPVDEAKKGTLDKMKEFFSKKEAGESDEDNPENNKNTDDIDSADRKSLIEKLGDKLSSIRDRLESNNEAKEDGESRIDGDDYSETSENDKDSPDTRKNGFDEYLRVDDSVRERIVQTAKEYRERNHLDENGYPAEGWEQPSGGYERVRGDEDPRETRYKPETENIDSTDDTDENNADDEEY